MSILIIPESVIHIIVLGRTPLFCAAIEGWHNLIPILAGTEELIEETDLVGETPLIAATKNGFSQTMKLLIEMGAYLSKRDKTGNNALDYALSADEKSIQDEQIFDSILSQMLNTQTKELALSNMQHLLSKYHRLKLKQSIFTLLDRIPELKAIKGKKLRDTLLSRYNSDGPVA